MNLFFLSNWQTMLLNVADLMLYFLRQRDELEACDVYARRLVARGDVYDRAMSMLVRCLCPCDVYAQKAGCSWREYQVDMSSCQVLF